MNSDLDLFFSTLIEAQIKRALFNTSNNEIKCCVARNVRLWYNSEEVAIRFKIQEQSVRAFVHLIQICSHKIKPIRAFVKIIFERLKLQ